MVSAVRDASLGSNRFPWRKLLWLPGIGVPLYLMVTVLMPDGFEGVPWMLLVTLVFAVAFGCLLLFERSAWWNAAIAFGFWFPAAVLDILYPGTERLSTGGGVSTTYRPS